MAVGKVSLDDWLRLTWSFGCTGDLPPSGAPSSSLARLAITSLAFMLVWVPEPVCQTTSGKWSASAPSATSWAARTIASARRGSRWPCSRLTRAAACLTMPSARTSGNGMVSVPIRKFCRLRWVCAPQ